MGKTRNIWDITRNKNYLCNFRPRISDYKTNMEALPKMGG
jgi:hypothetical protein